MATHPGIAPSTKDLLKSPFDTVFIALGLGLLPDLRKGILKQG